MLSTGLPKFVIATLVLVAPFKPIHAEESGHDAATDRMKIAVLDVMGSGPVDPQYVEGLSGVLAANVAAHRDLEITTSADIRQLLGLEAERQLLGCDGGSCMAEIGGALGVDFLISAEVSRVGENWLLNAGLVDVKRARTLHRVSRRTRDENELIDILGDVTAELLAELGLERRTPAAAGATGASVGRRSLAANTALGVGSLAFVGGGILYGGAWLTHSAHQSGQSLDGDPAISWSQAQAAQRNAAIGVGLLAGGAAITAASFFFPRKSPGTPSIALVPVNQGGLLVLDFSSEPR